MPTDPDRRTQTLPDSATIDVYQRAHVAVIHAVARSGQPHRRLVANVAAVMAALIEPEMHEDDARLIAKAIVGVIDDHFHGLGDEHDAAHRESETDLHEDRIANLRLIDGDTPERQMEHANALHASAAASDSYARVLRHKAARAMQRVRLGLHPHHGVAS